MVTYTGTSNLTNPGDSLSTNRLDNYDRNLLRRAVEKFVISKYTSKKSQPKFSGKTAIFSVYDQLGAATFNGAILDDGVTPAPVDITKTSVKADLVNRGAFIELTDETSLYGDDGARIIQECTDNLGSAAGMAIEETLFAEAIAGAGIDQVTTPPIDTETGISNCLLTLRNNLGDKFTSILSGSQNTDTKTIREAYIGFVHPNDTANLEAMSGWVGIEKYAGQDAIMGEVGSFKTSRWIETTLATEGTLVILAEEGLGEVGVRGKAKMQTIVKGLGQGKDELNQRQSVGVKYIFAAKVLQAKWVAKSAIV